MSVRFPADPKSHLTAGRDLDRRAALKLFVSGAAVALASCGRPEQQIVPYVQLPEGETPGVPLRFRRLCRLPDMAAGSW